MAQAELKVMTRESLGKGVARKLRRQGLVPATVYGRGMEPCSLSVDPKVLAKTIEDEAGWNTLLTLRGAGPYEGKVVIVKDMQVEAIRRNPTHVDFQAIDLAHDVHVMVPVQPVGKSAGEKMGGSLQVIRKELEVLCLPTAIPQAIEIDVTELNIGDVIHVQDLTLPEGVKVPHDVNFTVITLVGAKGGSDEEEAEEGEGEGGEEAEA